MDDVLTDLSSASLVRAIKGNLYDFFRLVGHSPTAEVSTDGRLYRWHTSFRHPWFNGVVSGEPATERDGETVRDVLSYFKSRNVGSITWWLEPHLSLPDWREPLLAHRFRIDSNTPGMAIDLQILPDDTSVPTNFKIEPVTDLLSLQVYARTFVRGYGLPPDWLPPLIELFSGISLELPVRHYVGYLGDEPVATSTLFLAAGVAGIYMVGTLPKARGQGIGAAVSAAPLVEARQMGYRAGTLQSSEMGYRVYQRLGFQELCRMEHFYWADDRPAESEED